MIIAVALIGALVVCVWWFAIRLDEQRMGHMDQDWLTKMRRKEWRA